MQNAHKLSDAGRLDLAKTFVAFLFKAIEQDKYPDDSVEGCFGVKMGDDVGDVVFGAWSTLVKYTDAATYARAQVMVPQPPCNLSSDGGDGGQQFHVAAHSARPPPWFGPRRGKFAFSRPPKRVFH